MDNVEASYELAGTGQVPGPVASCQELGGPVDVFVDPSRAAVSRSPTYQRLLTGSGFMDLSSGWDLAFVGHKRKIQVPSSSTEKKPNASFLVPGASSTPRTAGSRRLLSLPPPSCEPKPQPPSCPFATHRPASPSQTPYPGSPQSNQLNFGPHNPPGLGEKGSQDLRILSIQPLVLYPSRLTSSPAVPQAPTSCRPTCTPPWEGPQGARPPHSPILGQPAWEPAAPDGSGPLRLSKYLVSLSPRPSPHPELLL